MRARESRPGWATETAQNYSAATFKLNDSLAAPADLRAGFGVYVLSTCTNGVQRGQTFGSLAAAARKIERQRDRGLPVSATLVQLVPVQFSAIGEVSP